MKSQIKAGIIVVLLVMGLLQITFNFAPAALSDPGVGRREVWQVVNVTNTLPYNTVMDLNVTVNQRNGVYIACSNNVTEYFSNYDTIWGPQGYSSYMEWLNGTYLYVHHWGLMDWRVSNGSLGPISYSDIQFWGDMYLDSGGGVSYTTFMGNTYMADWNLSDLNNQPDIIAQPYWQGNQIKMINSMFIPNGTTINVVFKTVITETGGYTFNVTTTPGVAVSPSTWTAGGFATLLVPYDYSTIQAAIDHANPGGTIVVYNEPLHNGLYAEDLAIPSTKANLEIKPNAGASVTIKGVQHHGVPGPTAVPNIEINANGVKIHGFTIEGPDYQANYYATGMVIGASNVEIFDNNFKVTPGANSGEISQAIQTWRYNSKPTVDISGLNIHNNTFTHLSSEAAGYEGIWINLDTGNGTITIWNNTFTGNFYRAIATERSNAVISGNVIITDLAPYSSPPDLGGWQGINVCGANGAELGDTHNVTNVSVTGNTIKGSTVGKGFKYGIKLGYDSNSVMSAVTVSNNTIQTNEVGVWVKYSGSGVRIKWNNLVNNTIYGVDNTDTTQTTNAAYNWWGNETGPHHSMLNPTGLGDNVSDYVIFAPWLVRSNPPLTPVSVVSVDPPLVNLTTPASGTVFTVNVTIANVTMLYGFQFRLQWNSTLLDLAGAIARIPSVWGTNYISNANQTAGNYSLYASGRSPAPTFNGTMTVASIMFKSIYEPAYPQNVNCSLALANVTVADPTATPILCLVYSGNYSVYSARPKLLFANVYTAKQVPTDFHAYVNVTNVMNLTAFNFTIAYDGSLLTVLDVIIPVTATDVYRGWVNGTVYANVTGIIVPIRGSAILVDVSFRVARGFVWSVPTPTISSGLNFTFHTFNNNLLDHDAINGTYIYKPVPGDLSMDGLVDIVDLLTVAHGFGALKGDPLYLDYADLNRDDQIDILDIILVAGNFGRAAP